MGWQMCVRIALLYLLEDLLYIFEIECGLREDCDFSLWRNFRDLFCSLKHIYLCSFGSNICNDVFPFLMMLFADIEECRNSFIYEQIGFCVNFTHERTFEIIHFFPFLFCLLDDRPIGAMSREDDDRVWISDLI